MAVVAPGPPPMAAPARRRVGAQVRMELVLTLRRGESVLLTFLIPVLVLVFFSLVDVLPTGEEQAVDFLLPGVLALSVMSTAMTGLAIATGFERSSGVLKRLAVTPLTRRDLVAAKLASVLVVETLQVAVILVVGLLLGWDPTAGLGTTLAAMVLASVAFAGIGMLMAGTLPALTTLALANATYVVLLFVGGVVTPLDDLPTALRVVARALPIGALSDIAHGALGAGPVPGGAWLVLGAWALVAPALAAWRFRWE
ncbi:MAG TPA: ABC transporter permease [Acidimicrobiales bacterium]|nr:ABC transporter permease [Acidimicrobiales bacterium]